MKKILVIGFLMVLLLIPTMMIWWLMVERNGRLYEVEREIAGAWGGAQQIGRVELVLPYHIPIRTKKGMAYRTQWAHFLPSTLALQGSMTSQVRYRGIFKVPVYEATMTLNGTFQHPDLSLLDISASQVQWEQAVFFVVTQTPRINILALTWAGHALTSRPLQFQDKGFQVALPSLRGNASSTTYAFQCTLPIAGTQSLHFIPAGQETTVTLDAPWADPDFEGQVLPDHRTVTEERFHAEWKVHQGNRNFPQQWIDDGEEKYSEAIMAIEQSSFGVVLRLPIQMYQETERAIKYACLFILLTFVTYFLFEVFCDLHLHPLQYLMIGGALCLFYLLLLSTAEHLPFGWAYTIAVGSTVGLVTIYSGAILGRTRRAWTIGGLLSTLYGYLYILLQAEDYALLMGSVGLFAMLGLVMFITRKIDWYAIGGTKTTREVR